MVEHVANDDRPRVVVTCIIYKWVGTVPVYLITQRNGTPPYAGRWQIVGEGFEFAKDFPEWLDEGEGWSGVAERVARRGIDEETGLQVGHLYYVGNFGFVRPHDKVPVIGFRLYARRTKGVVRLNDESTRYQWITAAELQSYELIGSIADDIRMLDKRLKRKRNARRRQKAYA